MRSARRDLFQPARKLWPLRGPAGYRAGPTDPNSERCPDCGVVFLNSAHMPWLANTFWQLLLSLDLFCCRHCWTALSLPSCCRQKRDASRLQACCSCVVPIWLWASEDEMPDSSTRMATTYRMTISRERPSLQNDLGGVASWSLLQRASSATVPYTAGAGGSRLSLDHPAR